MIKVVIERHIKPGSDISPLLRELRAAAIHQPGYVTGETLVSTEDSSTLLVVSTWRSLDDWERWQASETRARLNQQIELRLLEKPHARTYQVMAVEEISQ